MRQENNAECFDHETRPLHWDQDVGYKPFFHWIYINNHKYHQLCTSFIPLLFLSPKLDLQRSDFPVSPLEQSAASWFDHQETSPRNHQHMERTPGALVHRLRMAPTRVFAAMPSCTVRMGRNIFSTKVTTFAPGKQNPCLSLGPST